MDEHSEPVQRRELIRERVEHKLECDLASLLSAGRRAERIPEGGLSERVSAQFRAFQATGLLPEEEADGWRERFARAAGAVRAPDEEVATPELRTRAGELLEAAHARLAGEGGNEDAYRGECARFFAMLFALKGVGLMSDVEEQAIYQRTGVGPGRPKPAPGTTSSTELRRVIAGPPQRLNGVRLSAAELWGDRVKLWWQRVVSPQERAEREREGIISGPSDYLRGKWRRAAGTFALSDDLGTSYEPEVSHGSGEQTPWTWLTPLSMAEGESLPLWGHATFRPAVPEAATWLAAVRGEDRFVLKLA